MNKHNFSPGPCILPRVVFKRAAAAILNFNDLDLSLLEISHRSPDFVAVMEKAQHLVRELLGVPAGYRILFLQGGASLQFTMAPYNLMHVGGRAAYLDTGTWSSKAIREARLFGDVEVVASSKDANYSYIPKGYRIPSGVDYLHFTSNNTIFGTQFKAFPKAETLRVCDMSSDIFSREIRVCDFDLIYAGAQKNMGPAGATLVIVKESILGKTGREIPAYLNYKGHIDRGGIFNTPPVFSVYASMLTLQWLKDKGGVKWIQGLDEAKAALLYDEIDRNPLFEGLVVKADRSTMNATFVLKDKSRTKTFDDMWRAAGIHGLKGHRSVGGYRASLYNALPMESVQTLVDVMRELESKG